MAVVLNGPLGPLVMRIASHVPHRESHGCARKSACAAQKRIDKSVWYWIARNIPVDMPGAIANHAKHASSRLATDTSTGSSLHGWRRCAPFSAPSASAVYHLGAGDPTHSKMSNRQE